MNCPVCESAETKKISIKNQDSTEKNLTSAFECRNCSSLFVEDYAKDRSYLYDENYAPWSGDSEAVIASKVNTFKKQLSVLLPRIDPSGKKLLDAGTAKGYLMAAAQELGFDAYGFDISKPAIDAAKKNFPAKKLFCGTLYKAKYKNEEFDVITMTDIIEHLPDNHKFMKEINRILKPNGVILIITPNSDSFTRKLLRKNWYQYKNEHIIYYSRRGLRHLLEKNGFRVIFSKANAKTFSLDYTYEYLKKYKIAVVSSVFTKVFPKLPKFIQKSGIPNHLTGEQIVLAKKCKTYRMTQLNSGLLYDT